MDSIQDLIDRGDLEPAAWALVNLTRHTRHQGEAQDHLNRARSTAEMTRTGELSPTEAIRMSSRLARVLTGFREVVERDLSGGQPRAAIDLVGFRPRQPEAAADDRQLRSVGWVRAGLGRARSVARIVRGSSKGTGFVVRPGWLLTCHHVLPTKADAAAAEILFGYESERPNGDVTTTRATLDAATWEGDPDADWAVARLVAVDPVPPPLELHLTLTLTSNARVSIIQHPNGGPMQVAMTANEVHRVEGSRVLYATHTLPGSSGSPVFDERWCAVAMHRAAGAAYLHEGRVYQSNEGLLLGSLEKVLTALA